MSVFVRSDLQSITISRDHGGCGLNHQAVEVDGHFTITCPACEPVLVAMHGASAHRGKEERTPDEIENDDVASREGQIATQQMAAALAQAAGNILEREGVTQPTRKATGGKRKTAAADKVLV